MVFPSAVPPSCAEANPITLPIDAIPDAPVSAMILAIIASTSASLNCAGKNFSILEFNGTGAEPNHIYDCGMSYFTALNTIATHWKYMYEIGKINHANGVPYVNFSNGKNYLQAAFKRYEELEKYDLALD